MRRITLGLVLLALAAAAARPIGLFLLAMTASLSPTPVYAQNGQEAICSQPYVLFCENWEGRATGAGDFERGIFKSPGWGPYGGGFTIKDGIGFRGSRAVEMRYPPRGPGIPPNSGDPSNGGAGYLVATWPRYTGKDFWIRYYAKWSTNFRESTIGHKFWIHQMAPVGGSGTAAFIGHSQWGGAPIITYTHDPSKYYYPNENLSQAGVPLGQWVCLETRAKMSSSPGVTDGAIQYYVNGTRVAHYPATSFVTIANAEHLQTLLSAFYNCNDSLGCRDPADAHPEMFRYADNIVISTQRVGCIEERSDRGPTGPSAAVAGRAPERRSR
jgi:hypothetical protein